MPVHANPADHFMDIVAGIAARDKQSSLGGAHVQGAMSPPRALFAQHAAKVLGDSVEYARISIAPE